MARRHTPRSSRSIRARRSLYHWHRYAGLAAALLAVVLALTGLALNHADTLRLSHRHVGAGPLLAWYGIAAPRPVGYLAGTRWVSGLDKRIYLDRQPVPQAIGPLVGAVRSGSLLVVAAGGELLLLTLDGEPVERLTRAQGLPTGLEAIGTDAAGGLLIRTPAGTYQADLERLEWHGAPALEPPRWARPGTVPEGLQAALRRDYRAHILTWERVLLDLHSGRFLGSWGIWLMDAAALLLVFLAASGAWLWLRQRRKRQAHRRPQVRSR